MHSAESDHGNNDQMQKLSDRFGEQQKSLAAFNAKNAGSIVLTPITWLTISLLRE